MRARILELRYHDGLSYTEIADRLGVTRGFVAGHLYRARRGMGVAPFLDLSKEAVNAQLVASGGNISAAARALGVSTTAIYSRLDEIPPPRVKPAKARKVTGRRRGMVKSTDPAVTELMAMIEGSGLTDTRIAAIAGINRETIRCWRVGLHKPRQQFLEWVREAIDRSRAA